MRRRNLRPVLLVSLLIASGCSLAATPMASVASVAPELPSLPAANWLNSAPLTLAALRGKPVLVEFWTFGCSNCRNTLPWLKQVHTRYAPKGLTIVAVHTPEFAHERDRSAVAQAVTRLGIRYPVMIDNDFAYWRALDNEYWPAFYLIDAQGRIVATRIGELHAGTRSADEFEAAIAGLVP